MNLKGRELITQACMRHKEVLLCIQGSKQNKKKKLGTIVLGAFSLTGVMCSSRGVYVCVVFLSRGRESDPTRRSPFTADS